MPTHKCGANKELERVVVSIGARTALIGAACLALVSVPGAALATDGRYIIYQNQTGVNLPGVVVPGGFDEVRAADGTTCRSSMAGSGAYLDSGIIGSDLNGSDRISAYGRLVVPLGARPPRLDCDRLYKLELERLQLEVQMLKRGLDPRLNAPAHDAEWVRDDGWTHEGRQ